MYTELAVWDLVVITISIQVTERLPQHAVDLKIFAWLEYGAHLQMVLPLQYYMCLDLHLYQHSLAT